MNDFLNVDEINSKFIKDNKESQIIISNNLQYLINIINRIKSHNNTQHNIKNNSINIDNQS